MSATNVILNIVNEAYLLPFTLTPDNVDLFDAVLSTRWAGANSKIVIRGKGVGERRFKGEFNVYYNRFDLSTLETKLEVEIDGDTERSDILKSIALRLNAFEDELDFEESVLPPLTEIGQEATMTLISVEGSSAYFGKTEVTLILTEAVDTRLMEDGTQRLTEDGSPRLMEG